MNDLALAAFAAETGGHVVDEPNGRRFERFRRAFDGERFRASLEAHGLRFVGRSEPRYPWFLRELHDPPPGLFVRGSADVELLSEPAVAIVGARVCSSYGGQVARMLGRELASAGLVVVSGLARGVDGEAHRGALEAGGWVAGSTATIPQRTLSSRVESAHPASSSPSTRRGLSRRRGASRRATGSSRGSAPQP
jgi:predicted Rossmann fold nucleotide-binding protein DprA/Smf involved in DNA uptake